MSNLPTDQLVLEAAIACIEKYGLDKTTTRRIAEEAGTNVAAINYYFRTKDELLAKAFALTIDHMLEDVFAVIAETREPFAAMVEDVFFYLIDGARRWPGITTAHLYRVLVQKAYDSAAGQAIRRMFGRLVERAVRQYPEDDPAELEFGLSQVLSAIMLTMLAPDYLPVAERYRPLDAGHCRMLARYYAAALFAAWGKKV